MPIEQEYRRFCEEHTHASDDLDLSEELAFCLRFTTYVIMTQWLRGCALTFLKAAYLALETFHKSLPPP